MIQSIKSQSQTLLPKIHKGLYNVPGKQVISNCGFYIGNISPFLQHYLQPLAQKVKSFIKNINIFKEKSSAWVNFRKELFFALLMQLFITLISHKRKAWPHLEDSQMQGWRIKVTTETFVELVEIVLKNIPCRSMQKLLKSYEAHQVCPTVCDSTQGCSHTK